MIGVRTGSSMGAGGPGNREVSQIDHGHLGAVGWGSWIRPSIKAGPWRTSPVIPERGVDKEQANFGDPYILITSCR